MVAERLFIFNQHIIRGGLCQIENLICLEKNFFSHVRGKGHTGQKCNELVEGFLPKSILYLFLFFSPLHNYTKHLVFTIFSKYIMEGKVDS